MATNRLDGGAELPDDGFRPRPAATVILIRGGAEKLELLLVRRNPQARLLGGVWVFPGGSLIPEDGEGQDGLMAAARRELTEETGISLNPTDQLVAFMRWITPETVRPRFDAWFYLAVADASAVTNVDGEEIVDAVWIAPGEALTRSPEESWSLAFPTVQQLRQLAKFRSAEELIAHARGLEEVKPVQPRRVGDRILLPGDAGYD
jgi:8-oxo-dGTP pyrophosphatase MutT (NUDIX family)